MNSETERDLDELVSSVLDGEATAEEEARVRSNDKLFERLRSFSHVASAVGSPVVALDEISSRRLLEDTLAQVEVEEDAARLEENLTAKTRLATRWRWVPVAAVLAMVALSIPLLRSLPFFSDGNSDLTATSSVDFSDAADTSPRNRSPMAEADAAVEESAADGSVLDSADNGRRPDLAAMAPLWLGNFSTESALAHEAVKTWENELGLSDEASATAPEMGATASSEVKANQITSEWCDPVDLPDALVIQAQYQGMVTGNNYDVIVAKGNDDTLLVYLRPWAHCRLIEILP